MKFKNIISKIVKLYRIQEAFEKYNILDIDSFQKDECFHYILSNFKVDENFETLFQEKYNHEITKTKSYQEYNKRQNETTLPTKEKTKEMNEKEMNEKEMNGKEMNGKEMNEKEIDEMNENEMNENEMNENEMNENEMNEKTEIDEINKEMFKKIVLLTHPDKSTKYENSQIFHNSNVFIKKKWTIGLVYCCFLLHIKLDFEIYDEFEQHIFKQMRTQIAEIITLYKVRKS